MFPAIIGLLMVALVKGQSESYPDVTIDPAVAIRRVNAELKILTKVTHPIDSCRVILGNDPYRLIPNAGDPEVAYFGKGLEYGECGVHIAKVHEDWNGNVTFILPPQGNSAREVSVPMRLIVALPPNDPELLSPPQPTFVEGEQFTAQCRVVNGRPAANISWYLDDQPVLMGTHQPVVTWDPATDTFSIRQNVTMVLSADDDGRRLACRASHDALDEQRQAGRQLAVHYPPKLSEPGPITIFGLKIGSEGRLNVTARANPAPSATWTVGSHRLLAPQATDDGLVTALNPVSLGNGFYEMTLVLARVAKEDVDRTYSLLLTNDLGQEEVSLRISTMDEPVGVELGAGAIVGIVIAVLILLIAVSMLVFAKATQRWCFAGRSHRTDIPDGVDSEAPLPPQDDTKGAENPSHDHGDFISNGGNRGRDHTRSSGESSDTESAVGGRERSRLAGLTARVRAALPRSKDKVQATDAPAADAEEKPLSEEKKGVVYAELVLSEQPTVEKPAPPATEYAEIVYTDQQGQQADTKETTN